MSKKNNIVKQILFIIYLIIIFWFTVINRSPSSYRIFKGLFWEIKNKMWCDIIKNILLFIPFGFLLPSKTFFRVILYGFFVSFSIEGLQFLFCLGICELDDVMNNVLGTILGYFIWIITTDFLNSRHVNMKGSLKMLKKWDELPTKMQISEVKEYYNILSKKKMSLRMKRFFDVVVASVLLLILAIPMGIIAILIVIDSPGGVFYRQERVTAYCKIFRIHKFRTMVSDADKIGSLVTVENDNRVTKIGAFLRKYRLDELPQLIDILQNNMSFVGTRPEALKYVENYSNEMLATLLLPAGITSEASIIYKDEAEQLKGIEDVDKFYLEKILPEKMKINLKSIKNYSFWGDVFIMVKTVLAVIKKVK